MPSPPPQFPVSEWVASNELAFAVRAPASRSPGHTIVVPRRPLASYFVASPEEKAALWALVDATQAALDEQLHPDGYEVGFTAGEVAGSIAPFAHIDVIPRFRQTVDDPLDVVRQQLAAPSTDAARATPLTTGGEHDPLSRHLAPLFASATDIAIVPRS